MSADIYDAWVSDAFNVPPDVLARGAPAEDDAPGGPGEARVSMRLPEPGDHTPKKAQQKPQQPPKTKTIDFGGDEITGLDPRTAKSTAQDIATTATTNANTVGVSILNACQKFKSYAEAKLDDVHDGASSLFKTILETSLDAVLGAKLLEKVAETIGKKIVDEVKKYVKGKIVDGVTSGLKDDSSNKELKKALDQLMSAATDSGGAIGNIVNQTLKPYLDEIVNTLNRHETLKPDQHDFIMKFVDAPPSSRDAYLEEIGIPSPANAKGLELAIYKKMVKGFELSVVKGEMRKEMGKFEFAEMAKTNPVYLKHEIRRRAEDRAETAMSLRAEEMRRNGR